jgi:hypothetical protein
VLGAFVMGVGIGVRSQVLWLTLPWFIAALVANRRAGIAWLIGGPVAALVAGGLLWAIPMILASGGLERYLRALASQANSDLSFVDMLWTDPSARHLLRALRQTFAFPWESLYLAAVVLAAAAAGFVSAALRSRRAFLLTLLGFVPYALFHLLFQETPTIRYALPLVVPAAFFAACAIDRLPRRAAALAAVTLTAGSLVIGVPLAVAYGAEAHPAFRAIRDMLAAQSRERPGKIFAHHAVGRALRVAAAAALPVVEPPERYEWLGPEEYWKSGGVSPVWFLADPRRTDLALFDPQSLRTVTRYRWRVGDRHVVGGTRPVDADWYRIASPGWFAGTGWSLTLEAGGLTYATHAGLGRGPIEAYVRRRPEPAWLLIGGRDLAAPASAPSQLLLTIDGHPVDAWTFDPAGGANFLRTVALPDGIPPGHGNFATLRVSAAPLRAGGAPPAIAIRQFDVQSSPTLMFGFGEGWHEEELDAQTGQRWRWTSDRSILQIVPPQAVEVRLRGESPRKYFDAPPRVRLLAGDREIAVLHPDSDFDWRITVPAEAVASAHGALTIETDRVYLPATAEGSPDTRRLGLRLFGIEVRSLLD